MTESPKNTKFNLKDTINELDLLIRRGQQGQAREILRQIGLRKIPREHAADLADIARRVNTPKIMISLLRPVVYPQVKSALPPNTREWALYATGLARVGVFDEAQKILKGLDENQNPEVLLFMAQNFMLQWDCLSAIPKLKKYVARKDVTAYSRLVGQVNLASSYINEMMWTESEKVFQEIWSEIRTLPSSSEERDNYGLLYANSLGLAAQSAYLQGDLPAAQNFVREAGHILLGTRSRYELLIKKWQSILDLTNHPNDEATQIRYHAMVNEAKKARDWETVRDFEFYEALALRNDRLFLKLYHGSPYPSFRKRIKKIYNPSFVIPKMMEWNWSDHPNPDKAVRVFDLSKGCEDGGKAALTSYPVVFNLLQILTKDFYRPVALGTLFSHLYSGELFNLHTSPNRVYLVVKRLRNWFEDNSIPLVIEIHDDWFKLVAVGDYILRVSFQNINVTKNDSYFESLSHHFSNQKFSVQQVAENLGLPESSTKRFLTWALQQKKIKPFRSGKSLLYVLNKASSP